MAMLHKNKSRPALILNVKVHRKTLPTYSMHSALTQADLVVWAQPDRYDCSGVMQEITHIADHNSKSINIDMVLLGLQYLSTEEKNHVPSTRRYLCT